MSALNDLIKEADELHKTNKFEENYKLLSSIYEKGERDPQLLWRLGRANYDMAINAAEKADNEKFTNAGLELVSEAKEKLPDEFASHKWFGILLGQKGDFVATKEKIANAYIIRDSFKKAVELNAQDPTSYYCLAKWCWGVLQVGWMERQAASLLFGTPPTSTYEECEEYLMASHKLDDKQIYVHLLLGDVKYQTKKYSDAKIWYEAATKLEAVTPNQKAQQAEAAAKAKKC